jgi:ATP-binding cassette subfamily C (CFTR/MRP) protein 4
MESTKTNLAFRVILEEQISNYTATNSTISPESDIFHHKKIFYTYTCLTAAIILTHLGTASSIVLFARKASIKLHEKMTASILSASMVFFDTNFVGNILNRFSKDLTTVDEMIPFTFHNLLTVSHVSKTTTTKLNSFQLVLSLTGIMILIASVNTLFLIPLTLFLMTIVVTRNYCIGTTRSLKRLDALSATSF